jgi:hypothetical protein
MAGGSAGATRDAIRGSSDRSTLVLTSLAGSPKQGYALIKDIEEFAGVKLGAGTLYGAPAKLEEDGLVEALRPDDRRQPYRITAVEIRAETPALAAGIAVTLVGLGLRDAASHQWRRTADARADPAEPERDRDPAAPSGRQPGGCARLAGCSPSTPNRPTVTSRSLR